VAVIASTIAGVTVFLAFLFFAVQLLFNLYATTVVTRAPSEEFRALAPYTIAIVELDEGPRLMGHARAGVAIGDRVVAGYFTFGGRNLVRFRAEGSPPAD